MAPALSPQSAYGRQAEARRNDLAVLEAARDVFTAQGAGAPVSAVAERAGVGMGTLYRRYGSKTELLQRLCLLAMEQTVAAAEASWAMSSGSSFFVWTICPRPERSRQRRARPRTRAAEQWWPRQCSPSTAPRWTSTARSAAMRAARPRCAS